VTHHQAAVSATTHSTDTDHVSRWERFVTASTELLAYGARKLVRDRAQQLAAALAYRTVFSLVPILVLALVAVRAVSTEDDLRARLRSLMDYFALTELSFDLPEIMGPGGAESRRVALPLLIDQFATNQLSSLGEVNFTAIAAVGVGILIYGAISLVVQVEQAFNLICRAPTGRRLTSRLVNYWMLLTLGPVALYLSFTLSGQFATILSNVPTWLEWATQQFLKVGVTWILLLFAYLQMPNIRVRIRPAAMGALVAAVLWEICKSGLTWFVSNATAGKVSVYGSLALLPIFLLWIYVTWLIVLFGLELASILQTVRNASLLDRRFTFRRSTAAILDSSVALQALIEIARGFRAGHPTRLDELAVTLGLTEDQVALIANAAVEAKIVHLVDHEDEPDTYSLSRPAESIQVSDAFEAFDRLTPSPPDESAKESLVALRKRQRAHLADQTLASMIESAPKSTKKPASGAQA